MKYSFKTYIALFLIWVVTLLVYSNHFNNAFHFDDMHTIVDNLNIRSLQNIPQFFKDGTIQSTLPANQSYRPLVTSTFAIDYWLGNGYNVFYFHLSTFIIFLLQVVAMFLFYVKIGATVENGKIVMYSSLLATAIFMLHPAIAETVNYISARSDLQSTFFVVLGFALYAGSSFCRKKFIYLFFVFIGGFAKPTAVMFAPILFFFILFFEENIGLNNLFQKQYHRQLFNAIKKSIPAFIVCGLSYVLTTVMTPASWTPGGDSAFNYCITQPFVLLHYFTSFFAPTGLSADTDWQVISTMFHVKFLIGMLFIIFLLLVCIQTSKLKITRPISFGILWFFIALIPTSSIIPLAEVLNDHRMYFPFVGLTFSATWAFALLCKYVSNYVKTTQSLKITGLFGVFLLLSICAYNTYERNKIWLNEETLWKDVTLKSPNNPRGQMNYGLVLMQKGDYEGAINQFHKTLATWPYYSYAYINMGIAKAVIGKPTDAEYNFKKAIQYNSNLPEVYYYYARFLIENNRINEATNYIERGLAISPGYANLALLKNTIINTETNNKKLQSKKIEELKVLVMNKPSAESYINLSLEYYNNGEYEECIAAANKALQYNATYDLAYNNICASYNMLKRWDKAVEAGEKGLKINPNNQLIKNNLAESKKHIQNQ